ncbi:hypothetical protein M011DRAFT_278625 [Sporormia fimetaria CBS 119925]|uniref:Uncharacterized protein n=1 Tax=Sporormia fimetaria CBS 119925 TaxID=1340428 RepID=A0A6A6VJX0_9PLEO|nr:hypothetical protein M011DRAFT_278625 [Sporormia fimetaria CBS 119925]
MLRLRPSEITLTPADVQETRRRIRSPVLPYAPQLGPKLRRGPNRSRDEAVKPPARNLALPLRLAPSRQLAGNETPSSSQDSTEISTPSPPKRQSLASAPDSNTPTVFEARATDDNPRSVRPNRFSDLSISEVSNTSLPYSYYELPSRRSSEQSQPGQLPQSQFDGAGPSRPVPLINRLGSISTPNLPGQHGLSPRPANPYTRMGGLLTAEDLLGDNPDASYAAQRNLPSPLDLLAQRAYIRLAQAPTRPVVPLDPDNRPTVHFRDQVETFDTDPRRRRPAAGNIMRQESGNSAHHRIMSSRQLPQLDLRLPDPIPWHHHHERSSTQDSDIAPPPRHRRHAPGGGRAGQRSSENVPVGAAVTFPIRHVSLAPHAPVPTHMPGFPNPQHPGTASQGATLRGGDIPVFPAPVRLRIPDPSSRRAGARLSFNPARRRVHEGSSADAGSVDFLSPPAPPPPTAYTHRYPPPGEPGLRRVRTSSGATTTSSQSGSTTASFTHQHHAHQPQILRPSTLASSATARMERPPVPLRITSRRVSVLQRDQENSGAAEEEMMRGELEAVRMRYGEDGAGEGDRERLDETPPRIGRFERRMMEG